MRSIIKYVLVMIVGLAINIEMSSPLFAVVENIDVVVTSNVGEEIGSCDLPGTILLPENPAAMVVFVHGSGALDRNQSFPSGHQPFADFAHQLASRGIASIRYDKRSFVSECQQAVAQPSFSPYHFVKDAIEVTHFVKSHPKTKDLPVLLLGHSQGVNFVVDIAVSHIDVAGVILLAGIVKHPIDVTILRQFRSLAGFMGLPVDQRQDFADLHEQGKRFFSDLRENSLTINDTFMGTHTKFWADWIEITDSAVDTTKQLTVPGIVAQGELDWNTTEEDFELFKEIFKANPLSSSAYFEGLDHAFSTPSGTTVPEVVGEAIAAWVLELTSNLYD